MRAVIAIAVMLAVMATSMTRAASVAHAEPALLWTKQFPANVTFGDPIAYCESLEKTARDCRFAFLVFLSPTLAQLHTFDAATGHELWNASVPFTVASQSYSGWVNIGAAGEGGPPALFTASDTDLFAFHRFSGELLWRRQMIISGNPRPPTSVPAHPSYFDNKIYYTFESGVNSSRMVATDATDGSPLWLTPERVVTLIWPVRSSKAIAYIGQDSVTNDVYVVARRGDASIAWRHGPLNWSEPGLWDNPNLDVDELGERVFMYQKPHIGLRQIHAFNSSTGTELWTVNDTNATYILDYDTYAYDNDFFRLRTVNITTMQIQRLDGGSGAVKWSTSFGTGDTNSILLVNDGLVFQFGLGSGQIQAFTATSGEFLATVNLTSGNPTTGATITTSAPEPHLVDRTLLGFGRDVGGEFAVYAMAPAQ
jgi:outer membrane protein assembly factor BamB